MLDPNLYKKNCGIEDGILEICQNGSNHCIFQQFSILISVLCRNSNVIRF